MTTALELVRPARFAPILADALRLGRGRPPRSFSQWVTEEVYLPMDGGPFQGKRYQFRFQPITKLWATEIDSGRWNEFIYSGPSQSGKSFSGYVCPLLYHMCELNESVGFGVPMEEMASDKWQADIKPVMESSHRLRRLLPTHGPGSAGGAIRDRVVFTNRSVAKILTAGGSDQAKAGYTLRVILVTEAARFSRSAKTSPEADPLEQLRARQRSIKVPDRRTYIDGTNTVAEELPASLWEASSQSRIMSQCPHCGGWMVPGRENLLGWQGARTEIEAAERAMWHCPLCGEGITTEERRECVTEAKIIHGDQSINKRGEITGDLPRTRRLYFSYGAWHNLFLDASDLAVDLWSAAQLEPGTPAHESSERKLCQFVFGTVYTPPLNALNALLSETDVSERRHLLPRGIAPADTGHLVCGVDLGEKAIHWVLMSVRTSGTLHVVDYGYVEVARDRPMREAVAVALDELFRSLLDGATLERPIDGRSRVALRLCHCDSGHLGEVVMAVCKAVNKAADVKTFLAILGRGKTQMDKRNYVAPKSKSNFVRQIDPDGRWHLSIVRRNHCEQLTLDADAYKHMSDNGFRTPATMPGAITLFSGPGNVHRTFARHQINEQWVTEELPGEAPNSYWNQTGANHYKDALAYAICAATRLGWSPATAQDQPADPKAQEIYE